MRPRPVAILLATALVFACSGDEDPQAAVTTETTSTTTEETTTSESTTTTSAETTTTEGTDSEGEFEEFTVDGEFSVDLPGEPQISTQEAPSDFGPISVDIYFVEGPDSSVALAVNDLPAERLADDPQVILADSIAGSAGSTGGTVVTEEEVTGEEFPSRDAELAVTAQGQEAVVFLRAVVVEDRLFQLQALGLIGNRDVIEAAFERLVSSFEPVV